MIEIEGNIVSEEILTTRFCCDIAVCRGECCVEGNAGAPLEAEEVDILEAEYAAYKPYMKPQGIDAVTKEGFFVVDSDGDLTTPLIGDAECAFSYADSKGVTLCAIEKAWLEGKTTFCKPISCHLYPIRLIQFDNGTVGLNYHRWSVCRPAELLGQRESIPLYKALKDPIIRRFGEGFFDALAAAEQYLNESSR